MKNVVKSVVTIVIETEALHRTIKALAPGAYLPLTRLSAEAELWMVSELADDCMTVKTRVMKPRHPAEEPATLYAAGSLVADAVAAALTRR